MTTYEYGTASMEYRRRNPDASAYPSFIETRPRTWRYLSITDDLPAEGDWLDGLNALGSKGWRFVHSTNSYDGETLLSVAVFVERATP